MPTELRPLTSDDLEQAWKLDLEVFNEEGAHRDGFVALSDPERFQGVFDDRGRLVATSRVIPFGQYFGGRRVVMGGLSSVAVSPEARGQGHAQAVVGACLRDMQEHGEVISSLFPGTTSLYRKLGWELAGAYVGKRIECRELLGLRGTEPARLQRAEPSDVPRMRACYERLAPNVNGFLDRAEPNWYFALKTFNEFYTILFVDERDEVQGYVVYQQAPPEDGAHGWTIRVRDWVAHTPSALRTLFWALGSSSTQAAYVRYLTSPEDPLLFLLEEQRGKTWAQIRWMTRIVDPEGAIAQRGFPASLDLEIPLVLDEVGATGEAASLARNAGSHRLIVAKGEGRLERANSEAGPRIGIGGFGSLYTGWADTGKLERAGLLTGGTAEQRAALDAAFAGPTPWMSEEF